MASDQHIKSIARQISNQPMGLAYYRPENFAKPTQCFSNVQQKVFKDGGEILYGWTFHCRIAESLPNQSEYIFVTHHAVWHCPDGSLIDVTPFHPDPKHHPYAPQGSVLFLVDDNALPVQARNSIISLPLKFFPLSKDIDLQRYIDKRNAEEQKIFSEALSA